MKKLLLYLGIPVASLLAYAAISYAATPALNIYQGGTGASSTAGYLGAQDRLGITGDVVLHRVSNNSNLVINASSTVGSDTGRGLALVYAVIMGSNGDFIYLASSTYDVQGVKLDPGSKNISIIGAGKYSTIIKGSNTTIIAVDGTTGLTLRDFSVYGTLGGGSIQLPIAGQSSNINNLVIDSIYTNNPSDGLYFSMVNNYATTTIKNVTCDSKWDCVYWLAKGGEGRIYDSYGLSAADASINSSLNAHGIIAGPNNNANLYAYNSKFVGTGGTESAGIRNDSPATGGKIYLFNTDASGFASSSSGFGRALYGNNGGQIYADGGYLSSSGRLNSLDISAGILNSVHVTSHTIYTAASSSLTTIDYSDWPMLDLAHAYNNYFRVGPTAARGVFDLNKVPAVTNSVIAATTGSGNLDNINGRTVSFDVYGYYTKNGTTYYTAAQNVAYSESGVSGAYYLTVTWNPVFLATGYKVVTNGLSQYAILDGKATTTTARSVTPGDGSESTWTTNTTVTPRVPGPAVVVDAWTGYFGIGTTSPYKPLSVVGAGGIVAESITATSSTAFSYIAGTLGVGLTATTTNSKLEVNGTTTTAVLTSTSTSAKDTNSFATKVSITGNYDFGSNSNKLLSVSRGTQTGNYSWTGSLYGVHSNIVPDATGAGSWVTSAGDAIYAGYFNASLPSIGTDVYGIYASATAAPVVGTKAAYGVYANASTSASTNTNPLYGVYSNVNSNAGTSYGLYTNQNNTTGYGVYASGGINYFSGNVGVGSTSPFAKLSIHAGANDRNSLLFSISSSTATVTTSLFTISNSGAINQLSTTSTSTLGSALRIATSTDTLFSDKTSGLGIMAQPCLAATPACGAIQINSPGNFSQQFKRNRGLFIGIDDTTVNYAGFGYIQYLRDGDGLPNDPGGLILNPQGGGVAIGTTDTSQALTVSLASNTFVKVQNTSGSWGAGSTPYSGVLFFNAPPSYTTYGKGGMIWDASDTAGYGRGKIRFLVNNTTDSSNVTDGLTSAQSVYEALTIDMNRNVGVGSTTPASRLSVTGKNGDRTFFNVASSTTGTDLSLFSIDRKGHNLTGGVAPTISACGTSPNIMGDDNTMRVTAGSGILSSCTVNFGSAWTNSGGTTITPACWVNQDTGSLGAIAASSTPSQVVISATTLTSLRFDLHCKASDNFTY